MIGELMAECRNYFEAGYIDGTFVVDDGKITPHDGILSGQYIAITGSTFHNGVWCVVDGIL